MNDLEGDSVSSKMARFDKPYISFYYWSVVKRLSILHISEILPLSTVPVILRSPSVSMQLLELQAAYVCCFICKHIVDNTCYISRGMGIAGLRLWGAVGPKYFVGWSLYAVSDDWLYRPAIDSHLPPPRSSKWAIVDHAWRHSVVHQETVAGQQSWQIPRIRPQFTVIPAS